jgi:hypothetical protein
MCFYGEVVVLREKTQEEMHHLGRSGTKERTRDKEDTGGERKAGKKYAVLKEVEGRMKEEAANRRTRSVFYMSVSRLKGAGYFFLPAQTSYLDCNS